MPVRVASETSVTPPALLTGGAACRGRGCRKRKRQSSHKQKSACVKGGGGKCRKPKKVKRARSAYILFGMDKRKQIKADIQKAQPNLSGRELAVEVMKQIAVQWKTISDTDKAKFQKLAEKDKKRSQRERKHE